LLRRRCLVLFGLLLAWLVAPTRPAGAQVPVQLQRIEVLVPPLQPWRGTLPSPFDTSVARALRTLIQRDSVYQFLSWHDALTRVPPGQRESFERLGESCGISGQLAVALRVHLICGMNQEVAEGNHLVWVVVGVPPYDGVRDPLQVPVRGVSPTEIAAKMFVQLPDTVP
jgi:hypothetical protein